MLIAPVALSSAALPREELSVDRKNALVCGNCALGKKAVYLGYLIFDSIRYIPLSQVERVYKRLAVSRGYFEGRTYGTLSYLIVRYDGGRLARSRMTREEDVDLILDLFRKQTSVPVGKQ